MAFKLNSDLTTIQDYAYKRKISFNPNRTKPAHEVTFSRKTKNITYPNLYLKNLSIAKTASQKHFGLNLDTRLSFSDHINEKIGKAIKVVGLLHRLQSILPRSSLLPIYMSFVRPILDYGNVTYYQPSNASFSSKIEPVQHYAVLAITGAIRGSSCEKLYQELRLEHLNHRHCMRRLCLFLSPLK